MTTTRRNYGPFRVVERTIRAKLAYGMASLMCEVQEGFTPLGRWYRTRPSWWIKRDGDCCWAGPNSASNIRKFYAVKLV